MQSVIIPARDGLHLNSYLTLPSTEAGAGKLPMVLLIHGGPYARDQWGFNSDPSNGWQIGAMRC